MSVIRITSIKKAGGKNNPLEAISEYGWSWGSSQTHKILTRPAAVSWLEKNGNEAYVKSGINKAYCFVNKRGNTKFLQTVSDSTEDDNLLSLPEHR